MNRSFYPHQSGGDASDSTRAVSRLLIFAIEVALLLAAAGSLIFALATSTGRGSDLLLFQSGAQNWLDGVFQFQTGPIHLYPPFALPLFAPLTLISLENLLIVFLLVNLGATAAVLHQTVKLFGDRWPVRVTVGVCLLFLAWAPFRVTLRNGQISILILAALLASLALRAGGKQALAGVLFGLALAKYSLTLPFLLYFIWKREWRLVAVSLGVVLALTQVFAFVEGVSAFEAVSNYSAAVNAVYNAEPDYFIGTTEIQVLFFALTGSGAATSILTGILVAVALVALALTFKRSREDEGSRFAALALFSLWFAYHRTYDCVILIFPAAYFVNNLLKNRNVFFSRFGLAALALFILSIPGFLTERAGIPYDQLASSPAGWLGLNIERLVILLLFWAQLFVMWKKSSADEPVRETMDPLIKTRSASG